MKPALFALFLACCACGVSLPPSPHAAALTTAPLASPCEVPDVTGVTGIAATAAGVVFEVDPRAPTVRRHAGAGCDLAGDGTAPVAAGGLLGADDRGNLYVYPRLTHDRGAVSTMLPGEYQRSMIAKVAPDGSVAKLLTVGRGIWGFGVSPDGQTLWFEGCAPGGVFSLKGPSLERVMPSPETLWNQGTSVLTDDHTFWSIGYRTCLPPAQFGPGCGYALTRSTPDETRTFGTTVLDLGKGFEAAELAPCGPRVCGLLADAQAVVVWDGEGNLVQALTPADYAARPSERIVQVSGNAHGVYLLLGGEGGTRVVFVAARP